MPLNEFALTAALSWELARQVTGFSDRTQGDSLSFTLAGLDLDVWNQLYAARVDLTATFPDAGIDLSDFTNLVCEGVALDKALALWVQVTGGDGTVVVTPGDAEPLEWFFDGPTDGIRVGPGELFMFAGAAAGAGAAVGAGNRTLKLELIAGSEAAITLVAVGGSA